MPRADRGRVNLSELTMSSGKKNREPNGVSDAEVQLFNQKIQRLDRLANLGLISASVAHEIKNGMVAINTFVQLLLQKGEDKELSETVLRELKRIDLLVSQMLRFAAPSKNTHSSAPAGVRVHELFEHSLRLLNYPLNAKLIKLQKNFRAHPDVVRGDEAQLQQVFMNLLLNAIEALGASGELAVSTQVTDVAGNSRQMLIEVKDTGVGIAEENLKNLFVPFFTTKKNGTGLGLTICQRIITDHGGSISAQSVTGQGSTFSILLPLAE